jgi:hypothetical protein
VAEYFRPALRFDTFCRRVNPDPIRGTSPRKLASAFRKSGITVSERRKMTYQDLILALEGGRPVVVHTWIDRGEELTHWVAAIGFDRRPQRICLMSFGYPGRTKEWFSRKDFERIWKRIGLICRRKKNECGTSAIRSRGRAASRCGSDAP